MIQNDKPAWCEQRDQWSENPDVRCILEVCPGRTDSNLLKFTVHWEQMRDVKKPVTC